MAYQVRDTIPSTDNKFYISEDYGGIAPCIQGEQPAVPGFVIKGCSSYVSARIIEAIFQITGKIMADKIRLNADAKYILERAKSQNLPVYDHPVCPGIAVWDDGGQYGHCAFVEKKYDENNFDISQSESWGNDFNYYHLNSDNNWAHPDDWYYNNGYKFIGCVGLPKWIQDIYEEQVNPTPKPTEPIEPNEEDKENEEEEKEEVELDIYDKVIDIWDKAETEEEALFRESMAIAEIVWNALPQSLRNEHLSNPKYYELLQTAIENIYLK